MTFANPAYFLLLLLLIPYIVWYILRGRRSEPSMRVSSTRMYATMPKSYKVYLRHAPFVLRMIALALLIVVLARPQSTDHWQSSEVEGIDIMLAVDVSTSMLAEDLKPNRIEAAKQVAADFINGRPNDNIGLTVFAGQSFTQSPLTVDHAVLLNLFSSVNCDMAMNGISDMSILDEAPGERRPVQTYVLEHDWGILAEAMKKGFKYVSLDELLKESDIISLHVPLNNYTKHMINENSLKKIKKRLEI